MRQCAHIVLILIGRHVTRQLFGLGLTRGVLFFTKHSPPPPPPPPYVLYNSSLNPSSKVLTKPHTGKEKPHPSTATEDSKLCVTKCRRLGGLSPQPLSFSLFRPWKCWCCWPRFGVVSSSRPPPLPPPPPSPPPPPPPPYLL